MTSQTKLWALSAGALAMSLALAGCGGGGSSSSTAPSTPATVAEDPTPPDPAPFMAMVDIGADEQTALLLQLPDQGNSATIMIAEGATVERAGVNFTCESEHPCTITLTNELGTIVASLSTYQAADATDDAMAVAMVVPPPPGPPPSFLARVGMNDWDTGEIRSRIQGPDADPGVDNSVDMTATQSGLDGDDDTPFTVRGAFNPNHTTEDDGTTANVNESHVSLMLGGDNSDGVAAGAVASIGLGSPWWHTVLHKDWGDASDPASGDGGYETIAAVYSDYESGMHSMAFDADLADKIADDTQRLLFTFNANVIPEPTGEPEVNDSVQFVVSDTAAAPGDDGTAVNSNAADAGTLTEILAAGEKVRGTYFTAAGAYTCSTGTCTMSRDMPGEAFTLGEGTWQFTPDPTASVMLPDQDWVLFGVWLTAPDNQAAPNAVHRVGVIQDGMDDYPTPVAALQGTAAYEGGAAGVYVDNDATGLFTATASLMADFGDDSAVGGLSGRIHSFMDADGAYLGDDPDNPGNSDWVVRLSSTNFGAGLGDNSAMTAGSADGIPWMGNWTALLYGGGDRLTASAEDEDDNTADRVPSGIAGTFSALSTGTGDDDALVAGDEMKGVAGAFGALLDEYTAPPEDDDSN